MRFLATLMLPFGYLKVKHPLKKTVDFWFPFVGATFSAISVSCCGSLNLFGQSGAALGLNGLIQILAGFFITSLAAVATFAGETYRIDEPFEGEKAVLEGDVLTRRQFLCLLFAYLAAASIVVYLVGVIVISAASTLHGNVGPLHRELLRSIFSAAYGGVLSHILGTTLIGLVFLAGRIPSGSHQPSVDLRPRTPSQALDEPSTASNAPTHATSDAQAPRPQRPR